MEYTMQQLKDEAGNIRAVAAVPDGYIAGSAMTDQVQHDRVPFSVSAHVMNPQKQIFIFGLTDEMFTTYINQFIKQTLKMVPNIIWTSVRDFVEPEAYLNLFAMSMTQMELKPVAEGDLPSIFNNNLEKTRSMLLDEYRMYMAYDVQAGTPTHLNNVACRSYLKKYNAVKEGVPYVVFAGMDYKGVEEYTDVSPAAFVGGLAGLLAGKLAKNSREEKSDKFGHGSPCDAIEWGAQNRVIVWVPAEYEQEATEAFVRFVSTFHMEDDLRALFIRKKAERAEMLFMQAMQYSAMAQQARLNLMQSQQNLMNTLARNSAEMSAGIMDSWNKKMASDSRISQARTEAIMGTNTYTTTYGQHVDVSVAADHVYQNQYGDVYGVSGTALDQEALNALNWRELNR